MCFGIPLCYFPVLVFSGEKGDFGNQPITVAYLVGFEPNFINLDVV